MRSAECAKGKGYSLEVDTCRVQTVTLCVCVRQSGLADAVRYEHMTVDSLKLLCKRRQLKVSGTKHELIRKLLKPLPADRVPPPYPPPEADQGSSASGRIRGEQRLRVGGVRDMICRRWTL